MRRLLPPLLLAAAIATSAQLGMLLARAHGTTGGYAANTDELFYATLVRRAAADPAAANPFDVAWHDAAPSSVRLLSLAVAAPVRAGVPGGAALDAGRWAGTAASALIVFAIGSAAASPAAGAAAAVLILLDPGAYYGKPFAALLGIGAPHESDTHPLFFSRLLVPSLTLPLFLLAILGIARAGRRRMAGPALLIGLVGVSGHLVLWSAALAAAAAVVIGHPHRRRIARPVAAGILLALVLVAIATLGRHGAPLPDILLRLGAIRTHRPLFLTHAGFWAAAGAAVALIALPWRLRSAARALGWGFLGAWALALLHTPLTGWDAESFHFAYALGPLAVLCWVALAWAAWRRFGRPRLPRLAIAVALAAVALAGARWSARGYGAALAEGSDRRAAVRTLLADGAIPAGATLAMPPALVASLGAAWDGVVFAHPYQALYAVPDSVLFTRAVCAAVLTGTDTSAMRRVVLAPRGGNIAVWNWGRPADISLSQAQSYFDLFDTLAARLADAISEAARDSAALQGACAERPDYALAAGRPAVRRALDAAARLGGSAAWVAEDSSAAWVRIGESAVH